MTRLPAPPAHDPEAALAWVAEHLGDLALEGPHDVRPGAFRGGQTAADAALAALDVTGYANTRNTVLPEERRGATRVSPYVRHGLLPLRTVWDAVADAPSRDRAKYRDELLWQEYARHLYARVGTDLGRPLRREQPRVSEPWENPWPREMACMDHAVALSRTTAGWSTSNGCGWPRSGRCGRGPRGVTGEDLMFRHLLDGSRAANRLGWQWTVGTGSKPYGFTRWQVRKRSPELCRSCALSDDCPVEDWPDDPAGAPVDGPDLRKGPVPGGPGEVEGGGADRVWLTAESLGTGDPALASNEDRPAVFCFDEPLLRRLQRVRQAAGLPGRDAG